MDVLKNVWERICDFCLRFVWDPIKHMDWKDVTDVLLLAVSLYILYRFFRTRRAGRVMLGLGAIVVFSVLVVLLELPALTYLVRLFSASAFFCVIVIFQPEIRDALESIGNLTVLNPFSNRLSNKRMEEARSMARETVKAVSAMSESHTGALIVFEGLTKLGDCIQTGKPMDARVTSELLQNIFFNKAPLHDGALVIRDMRIHAASCVLPSARGNMDFGTTMGTRHRAAVGVTEVSDALVVVVSEQTGTVSVAQNGKLLRGVDEKTLFDILMTYVGGKTYLRQKRANMRHEYLQMMEELGRAEPPVATKNEAVEKEFERLFGSASEEDSTPEGTEGQPKQADTKKRD